MARPRRYFHISFEYSLSDFLIKITMKGIAIIRVKSDEAYILASAFIPSSKMIRTAENGTITACAPHSELLRISPTYREIYESQNKTSMKGGNAV